MDLYNKLRKPLREIIELPERPIDTITLEAHVWKEEAGKKQRAQGAVSYDLDIVDSFVPTPEIRGFVEEVFNKVVSKEGQGWWIQSEFGSGKSHLLAFFSIMLSSETDEPWDVLAKTEKDRENRGKLGSLAQDHFRDIKKMAIFPIVCSLVGKGGTEVGSDREGRPLIDYIVEAAQQAYQDWWGEPLYAFPSELVVQHFRDNLTPGRKADFSDYLADNEADTSGVATYEDWVSLASTDAKGAGDIVWAFYKSQGVKPDVPTDAKGVLDHLVEQILDSGFDGIIVVLDEVSEFLAKEDEKSQSRDEDCLLYLSEQLTRTKKKPVWTFCAAQSKMETTARKIIAENRLKEQSLLMNRLSYYDIVLKRTRTVTNGDACDGHFTYYRDRFQWVKKLEDDGLAKEYGHTYHTDNPFGDELARRYFCYLFPYHPMGLDSTKAVAFQLTTTRAGIVVLYDALKTQMALAAPADSEMVTPDRVFDQFESLSDGSNAIRSKFGPEYEAFERARDRIMASPKLSRARYNEDQPLRCLKVLMMAYLQDRANPKRLSPADVADAVMVTWQGGATAQDNKDFFSLLLKDIAAEVPQVKATSDFSEFWFDPSIGEVDPSEVFERLRKEIEGNPRLQDDYWDTFLALDGLIVKRPNGADRNFLPGRKCDFADMANADKFAYAVTRLVVWRGKWVRGKCQLGDLSKVNSLQPIKTAETDEDFVAIISRRPSHSNLTGTLKTDPDPRYILWEPADLSDQQRATLCEWGAYLRMIENYKDRESEEAETVLKWVGERLPANAPQMMSVVVSAYGGGRIGSVNKATHTFSYSSAGQFDAVIEKAVGEVLDIVYDSRDIEFTGAQKLGDDEVSLVANSLVRFGEVKSPTGKEDKYTSAASNFGLGLQLVKSGNLTKMDLGNCRCAGEILNFITSKVSQDPSASLPLSVIYNNFMGIDPTKGTGPGLTRRMIQLYVLSLVKQGQIKVGLKVGTLLDVTEIDYSNIGDIDFRLPLMQNMTHVSVVAAPADWNLMKPFMDELMPMGKRAVAGKDESQIKAYMDDYALIYSDYAGKADDRKFKLDSFFLHVTVPNGLTDTMLQWTSFFSCAQSGNLDHKLAALKRSLADDFGLDVSGATAKTAEVLKFREGWGCYSGVCRFVDEYKDRVQLAFAYVKEEIPHGEETKVLRESIKALHKVTLQLDDIIKKPAKAESDFVPAYDDATKRYLEVYRQVHSTLYTASAKTRRTIEGFSSGDELNAVALLDEVENLGAPAAETVRKVIAGAAAEMPVCDVQDHSNIATLLKSNTTCKCLLKLSEAAASMKMMTERESEVKTAVNNAVAAKADVLLSDGVRDKVRKANETRKDDRLEMIAGSDSSRKLASYLVSELAKSRSLIDLLKDILKDVRVVAVPWGSLAPPFSTVEEGNLEAVVEHVRTRLQEVFSKAGGTTAKVVAQFTTDESRNGEKE